MKFKEGHELIFKSVFGESNIIDENVVGKWKEQDIIKTKKG